MLRAKVRAEKHSLRLISSASGPGDGCVGRVMAVALGLAVSHAG